MSLSPQHLHARRDDPEASHARSTDLPTQSMRGRRPLGAPRHEPEGRRCRRRRHGVQAGVTRNANGVPKAKAHHLHLRHPPNGWVSECCPSALLRTLAGVPYKYSCRSTKASAADADQVVQVDGFRDRVSIKYLLPPTGTTKAPAREAPSSSHQGRSGGEALGSSSRHAPGILDRGPGTTG